VKQGHGSEAKAGQETQNIQKPTAVMISPPTVSESSHSAQFPSKLRKWAFRGFAFGLSAAASATIGAVLVLITPLPSAIAPEGSRQPFSLNDLWRQGFRYQVTRPVNILVMGIDLPLDLPEDVPENDVFAGRSDTMLLLRVDPDTQAVSVLSIPRDTQVDIPGLGIEKINYANVEGGPTLSAQVVSRTLNGVTIDRYVRVSTGAFRELVDLMGGIEVDVPERMEYVDNTQKLKIDLQPGRQTLTGEQAEQFARFRNDANGDIGRVQRQQQVIRALREKLSSPVMITRIPQAIELFQKYIDTNLTMEEMLALANFGLDLDQENFRMVLLPGRFSTPDEAVASYWILDSSAKDQVMQEHFDVSSIASISQSNDPRDLRVAVQNASSNPQLGSQVAAFLQAQGFDNVYVVEDWIEAQPQTQIIAQRGDLDSAAMMETTLGLGQVVSASTGDLSSDLTIRVGNDWLEQPRIQNSY
jgi:polyisoprenyl-teichoic acid--peptidoglycan teichoic acid transferase